MQNDAEQTLYYTGGRRLSAAALDLLPCLLLSLAVAWLSKSNTLATLLAWPIYMAYVSTFHLTGGVTPGKRIMGLRTVDCDHRSRPETQKIMLREFLSGLCYAMMIGAKLDGVEAIPDWILLVGTLWLLAELGFLVFHPAGRTLHDFAANTCVLHHPDPRIPRGLRRYNIKPQNRAVERLFK